MGSNVMSGDGGYRLNERGRAARASNDVRSAFGIMIAVLMTVPATSQAAEGRIIRCVDGSGGEAVITLGTRRALGEDLGCIRAPFVVDMTACAPANGYGLSAPTGDARLVGIARRWQEYSNHHGPVFHFVVSEDQYILEGGFHGEYYQEAWNLVISRISGEGIATISGQPPISYKCGLVKQSF